MQPAVLLFDLGGVLLENVGFERFNALLASPIPSEELKAQWLAFTRSQIVRDWKLYG